MYVAIAMAWETLAAEIENTEKARMPGIKSQASPGPSVPDR
jgi:hypothetical protein